MLTQVSTNETKRTESLQKINIINSQPEESFDNIAKLASYICQTPISFISLIDEKKQWFKSKVGIDLYEADKEISFCKHTVLEPKELLEVKDTRKDSRFQNNPFVIQEKDPVIFYTGMPLVDNDGLVLGTLCVLDTKPRELDEIQKEALKALAKQVENLFDLKQKNYHLERIKQELDERNTILRNFAGVVSHDMKMPLANIVITTDILKAKYGEKLDKQGIGYLDYLKQSSLTLSDYITGILNHYESDTIAASLKEEFDIHHLLEEIIDLLNIRYDCEINLPENNKILHCNKIALEQIFLNLLTNSLKYNDKEKTVIDISFEETTDSYIFKITDNGIGIPLDKQEEIFNLFTTLAETDRNGNLGNGIGLSTVKKLITSLGGEIKVSSVVNEGTSFTFSIKGS